MKPTQTTKKSEARRARKPGMTKGTLRDLAPGDSASLAVKGGDSEQPISKLVEAGTKGKPVVKVDIHLV